MNYYIYRRFLAAEIVVIVFAVLCFRFVESRLMAGAAAGTLFTLLGVYIVLNGVRIQTVRRSACFVAGLVHLFVIALPLMITRFLNAGADFADVNILGLPGPAFHRLSTGVYLILIVSTVTDMWRSRKERHKAVHPL